MKHNQDRAAEQAFDSLMKKSIKGAARDYYRKARRRREHEVYFSELTEGDLAMIATTDRYFMKDNSFDVLGWTIDVEDADLVEALKELPSDRRDIVLLSFFLRMTDKEIADCLELANSTVAYRRNVSLDRLREIMGVHDNGQCE